MRVKGHDVTVLVVFVSVDVASQDLDELMQHEQRMEALRSHGEAWAVGIRQGIDAGILAETALYTAFHELIRNTNEQTALDLVEQLKDRILCGEFEPERICH
jgi:hypothetical protein